MWSGNLFQSSRDVWRKQRFPLWGSTNWCWNKVLFWRSWRTGVIWSAKLQDLQKEGAECRNWGEVGWYSPKIGWICNSCQKGEPGPDRPILGSAPDDTLKRWLNMVFIWLAEIANSLQGATWSPKIVIGHPSLEPYKPNCRCQPNLNIDLLFTGSYHISFNERYIRLEIDHTGLQFCVYIHPEIFATCMKFITHLYDQFYIYKFAGLW